MFNKTKMMVEAANQSKAHSASIETLIFFVLMMVINFVNSILLMPVLIAYIYSDRQLIQMSMDQTVDIDNVIGRIFALFNTLPEWVNILTLFLTVSSIIVVIIYCKCIEKRTVSSMGLRKGHVFCEYSVGFFIGLIMMSFVFAACYLSGVVDIKGINSFSPIIIILYFFAYIIQGMSEELLVRGYYMTSLTKSGPVSVALLMSSMLFALLHLENNGVSALAFINLLMFGVFTGIYLIKRGNIWGISGIHSAWNFSQGIIFGFSVSGMDKTTSVLNISIKEGFDSLTGGKFGPEGGLFVTLVLFLGLGALFILKPNKNEIAIQEGKKLEDY